MYLPMGTLCERVSCSQTSRSFASCVVKRIQLPFGGKLPRTLWLCMYCPLIIVARDGQQSGKETYASLKLVPCAASSDCTFGIAESSLVVMSSVRMKTTF